MPSAIDATKPIYGTPTTQSVRDNFAIARDEISALQVAITLLAPKDSPVFTGDPHSTTPSVTDNDTSIATTAYVRAAINNYSPPPDFSPYAPLDSPVFVGNPTAPTPSVGDNDTSIATTKFVKDQAYLTISVAASTYAPINSPTLTGDPRAPTPATSDNDTSIATTAFVKAQSYQVTSEKGQPNGYAGLDGTGKVPSVQLPAYVDDVLEFPNLAAFPATGTVGVIYVALDTNRTYRWSGSIYVEISPSPGSSDSVPEGAVNKYYTDARRDLKADLASPIFTGDPRAPTPATADNDTSIATTAYVKNQGYQTASDVGAIYAPINSPTLTGDPKAPTPATGDNDTSIATTAFVKAQNYAPISYVDAADSLKAPLASPALTGNPTAPTPTPGDNDTSIATTGFVSAAIVANPSGAHIGNTPPTSPAPTNGRLWFHTDLGLLLIYYNDGNSAQWVPSAGTGASVALPPGSIVDFAGTVAPDGYLLCNGQSVAAATYPALYAAIGTRYGGSGPNFNVPDLGGRVTAGKETTATRITTAGSGIDGATLGAAGGNQLQNAHTHGPGSFATPDHLHSPGSLYAANHGHTAAGFVGNNLANGTNRAVGTGDGVNQGYYQDVSVAGSGNLGIGGATGAADRSLAIGGTSGSTGAGASQNMPPVMIMNKIIKY